jgi:ABC-2 type transport system permease protein
MPVRPYEIVFSKLLATGGTVLVSSLLSLIIVIEGVMGIPVTGALWLYVLGAAIYTISIASIGLLLASFTHTMGQFGLLMIPAIIIFHLLSGSMTPMESMPDWLQLLMKLISPSPHFVNFTQSVLYRDSGIVLVSDQLAAMTVMSVIALTIVILRFRRVFAG